MKRILSLLAAGLFVLGARAQGDLMLIPSDAQSLGMGGIAMTNITGGHAIYANPAASIFSREKMQLSGSYLSFGDDYYAGTSAYYKFDTRNLVQAGWRRHGWDGEGSEMSIDLGYSRRLGEKWSIGVVGRYSWDTMFRVGQEHVLAFDVGAMYSKPLNWKRYSTLRLGMKLGNVGTYLNGPRSGSRKMTPITFDVGIALDSYISDAHELTFALDVNSPISHADAGCVSIIPGVEYNLMQLIQFRAGYHISTATDYKPSFGTVGVGVRFLHARLDFAYIMPASFPRLRNSWCVSFGLDF